MAHASIIPPATFVEHATKLRSRMLEKIAAEVEQEMRIRLVPLQNEVRSPRRDLHSILRHFRGRLL